MKVELSDTELQEAVAEYIARRFPNHEMGTHSWDQTRGHPGAIEAMSMNVELIEKDNRR